MFSGSLQQLQLCTFLRVGNKESIPFYFQDYSSCEIWRRRESREIQLSATVLPPSTTNVAEVHTAAADLLAVSGSAESLKHFKEQKTSRSPP